MSHYYTTFDTNRAQLATLYQPHSMLTFEGSKLMARDAASAMVAAAVFFSHCGGVLLAALLLLLLLLAHSP